MGRNGTTRRRGLSGMLLFFMICLLAAAYVEFFPNANRSRELRRVEEERETMEQRTRKLEDAVETKQVLRTSLTEDPQTVESELRRRGFSKPGEQQVR